MFTGIIEKTARVIGVADGPMFRRLTLVSDWPDVRMGESVAVNGVCLTVAELSPPPNGASDPGPRELAFDVIRETLSKTNLGLVAAGDVVHVERSLRVGDRLDGHFVQGHVDGTAPLVDQQADGGDWRLTLEAPRQLGKYLVPKGSVTLDGVSLTIANVDGNRFEVALIPTTLQLTELGKRPVGYPFNLECDMLAKTVVSFLERRGG